MSQHLSSAIDQVSHDLGLARVAHQMFGSKNEAKIAQLKARLSRLQAEDAQEKMDSLETHRRYAEAHKAQAKPSVLVPLGADEHVGTGQNRGYAMDGLERTRRL